MDRIEITILQNLIHNEEFLRKVLPFIEPNYFSNREEKIIFEEVAKFAVNYNNLIPVEALLIEIDSRTDVTQQEVSKITSIVEELSDSQTDLNWMIDTTEKWCKDRAIYLALMESIKIADGRDDQKNRDAIPSILSKALSISFDNHIGHDYLIDYKERYETYHRREDKIPFDLELFNKITKGGLPNKTLNVALAGCVHPETQVRIRFRKIS